MQPLCQIDAAMRARFRNRLTRFSVEGNELRIPVPLRARCVSPSVNRQPPRWTNPRLGVSPAAWLSGSYTQSVRPVQASIARDLAQRRAGVQAPIKH